MNLEGIGFSIWYDWDVNSYKYFECLYFLRTLQSSLLRESLTRVKLWMWSSKLHEDNVLFVRFLEWLLRTHEEIFGFTNTTILFLEAEKWPNYKLFVAKKSSNLLFETASERAFTQNCCWCNKSSSTSVLEVIKTFLLK